MKSKKTVEIKRFDNFSNKYSDVAVENFYNYAPSSKLQNSIGVKVANFPLNYTSKYEDELDIASTGINSVEGIAYFKQYFPNSKTTTHRLLVYGDDKKVYINQMLDDSYELFWLYSLQFNSAPITLSYKKDDADAIILSSVDQMKIWKTNRSPYTIDGVPIITSMCINEGVLFCTIKDPAFKVWYATDLNAENIGNISVNSGYISLEDELGYARKIVTFNEDVYVIRDYGISKISNIKNEFSVSQIYLSNTKIYSNTVSICGNSLLFMTKDGLYTFNGVKVSKTNVEFSQVFNLNDEAVASSLGENYYLALRVDFDDNHKVLCENEEYVNNVLLALNTQDFSYQLVRGVDIKAFLPIKTEVFEKMLVIFNSVYKNKIGEVVENSKCVDNNLPKFWSSKQLVDNSNTKLFTKLSVYADANVKFTIKYDDRTLEFTTYKSGLNEFMFKICCKNISLEISSNEETAIVEKVALDYYEY